MLLTNAIGGGGVPILAYHSLDDTGSVISTPPTVFRQQMRWLHDSGRQALSLAQYLKVRRGEHQPPTNAVVLTFDDGFRSVAQWAAPVLKELGFSATLFIVAGRCGMDNSWEGQPANIPRLALLDWDEIASLAENAFEIGAHTLTHPSLLLCDSRRAQEEIVGCRQVLEQRLGTPVTSFAYPYGDATSRHRQIVANHFEAACGTRLGVAKSLSDVFRLPRIEMYYFRSLLRFRALFSAVGPGCLRLQRVGRNAGRLLRNCRAWRMR